MGLDKDYQRALAASGGIPEAIAASSKIVATTKWGDPAYHDAHEIMVKALEAGLKNWAKANPPGVADYTKDTPMRGVWLYRDTLQGTPGIVIHVIDDVLTRPNFPKIVTKAIQAAKGAVKRGDKDRVTAQHPQYPQLLLDIAEAKRAWKIDDQHIRKTHAFRMMGGLARMGTQASVRYHGLVKDAQRLERSVLGKELTKATNV